MSNNLTTALILGAKAPFILFMELTEEEKEIFVGVRRKLRQSK